MNSNSFFKEQILSIFNSWFVSISQAIYSKTTWNLSDSFRIDKFSECKIRLLMESCSYFNISKCRDKSNTQFCSYEVEFANVGFFSDGKCMHGS